MILISIFIFFPPLLSIPLFINVHSCLVIFVSCSLPLSLQHENGEMLSPFLGAMGAMGAMTAGRDRLGDSMSSLSSLSSMSPLPSSPAQALGYRGREGSFESRYQSPLDDFRVSQEALLDHMDPQNRSRCVFGSTLVLSSDTGDSFYRFKTKHHHVTAVYTAHVVPNEPLP